MVKDTKQFVYQLFNRHKTVDIHLLLLPLCQILINEAEARQENQAKTFRKTVPAAQTRDTRRPNIYVSYWASTT